MNRDGAVFSFRIRHKSDSRGQIKVGIFVELDVVVASSAIEKLYIDLLSCQRARVQADDGENPLHNLTSHNSVFVKAWTENEHVNA